MPEDKEKAVQDATRLAESLLGACARVGNTNPLQRTPLTGRFHIEGITSFGQRLQPGRCGPELTCAPCSSGSATPTWKARCPT
jgi:hypothetical protein